MTEILVVTLKVPLERRQWYYKSHPRYSDLWFS